MMFFTCEPELVTICFANDDVTLRTKVTVGLNLVQKTADCAFLYFWKNDTEVVFNTWNLGCFETRAK